MYAARTTGSHRARGKGAIVRPPFLEQICGFNVKITRKRIRNLTIRVDADGLVEASVPERMPITDVKSFIRRKAGWIEGQQRRLESSPQARAERATDAEKKEWRALVSAIVPALIEKWEPVMGVHAGTIAYRNMKSRWGSCRPSTGRLCFNTRLALYPPECLEYVVVHELCHLRVPGHGPDFWKMVSHYLPNWKHAYELLKR